MTTELNIQLQQVLKELLVEQYGIKEGDNLEQLKNDELDILAEIEVSTSDRVKGLLKLQLGEVKQSVSKLEDEINENKNNFDTKLDNFDFEAFSNKVITDLIDKFKSPSSLKEGVYKFEIGVRDPKIYYIHVSETGYKVSDKFQQLIVEYTPEEAIKLLQMKRKTSITSLTQIANLLCLTINKPINTFTCNDCTFIK